MAHLPRRLAIIAIAILAILAFGTAGFVLIEHYPLFDAFYMTLITVTTVGYAEIHTLSHAGRVFNSVLIFFGVTVMLLAVGAMTQTIIELELNQFFGKRRVRSMIDRLHDHYIVCGFGRVGRGAAQELAKANVAFVVIDREEERVERAMKAGMLAVLGDATHDDILREIGIGRAKGVIATLASDADNLFLILSAKALNSRLHFSARVDEEASEEKMRRAGANFVFAPYISTGHRMAQALIKPHVQQFFDFTAAGADFTAAGAGASVCIEQLSMSSRSKFAERTLGQMNIQRELSLIILALRKADGSMTFNPTAEQTICAGDFLIVMGESQGLRKLEQMLTGAAS